MLVVTLEETKKVKTCIDALVKFHNREVSENRPTLFNSKQVIAL
jgi:hypothetical protein